ncbi:MAG: electron transfer flavoprotein subunit alpha/FixB family protein [Deltaproteobacteria bacterium]|jgi:electron transfer flavoprotein alpha subunit|nr:electron transfer flavoprotein subunit alpha/FixB family protein [Deltaproteobacteria bacterium]MBT4638467.1 electron transfer flavoprotein subunit alpha/FixB family protein [Deltaproteobacteria bacterium]MBT6503880.1 electron transfer flavoprotein subunit alpha/FixB family protein [Deltaproteobacteria bacterium]MBT7153843.1 electron transfer flavoprotein subunit alpha/FixB family protein [Deltaproteobacteria bacterium]MBT7714299.1 electron transfer flavoprotein subunit alpha/FixB family pro
MTDNHGPVWVIAEQEEGQVHTVSSQLTGQARKLADELNTRVEAILLGNGTAEMPRQLFAAGADKVYLGNAPELDRYQSELFTEIIVRLAETHQPEIVLLGSTPLGRELAPLVAARLKTGLTAHCIDLVLDENRILQQKIPAYGGMLTIICPEKRPQMATVAKGVFPMPELKESREGEIVPVALPAEIPDRLQTLEIVREEPKGVPLESASIVVAGGAGAGGPDGWSEISDLASTLGAALGATRPAVDEGWTELETMVGQSGKMVGPECYIGIGLSGELQHMVGIVGAKIMAAVNNDPKSPVFEQVDFGIVDDCREFVPVLIEKLKGNR